MLKKAAVNYDAPVTRCPTKDNAYVDIDIHFTFRLPQTDDLVKNFVYRLGAGRFDELLTAEVEENIRNFINTIWLTKVFDLKSDMASAMMEELNRKFQMYGIQFEQCNVTNVKVNPQMTQALQEKTRIQFELKNHAKEQENKKLKLENEESQALTDLQRRQEREMFELMQKIERAKVDKEQDELQADTQKEVKKVKAEEDASVAKTRAEGQQRIIVNEVKADTVTHVNKAKTAAQKLRINTDQQIAVMDINTQTDYQKAGARYAALTEECRAEEANLDAINAEREHKYQLAKAEAFENLSQGKNTKIVMSGSSGENLINKIFEL